ncbi:beta-fructofuranosidase, insoluble isoenzyme 3-like isoform X1 [Cynara cardunculus var. scolymus]|uniref:beta-fructofuranosidase, insoluble isoenzyme 3-like isoform X1 n=2 Tax=Cynara cardunculus var. scolymus TaxID=59895 RepID=UPI000D627571|nr:beta-fructofuranosidase, insoluble isoenzyme 3-like isoform X1 [Cynara cardunculus var. scolymus]
MGGFNVFVWGMVGLVCFFPMLNHFNGGVMAFHKISLHLQHRSAAKVEDDYRTGYHFQPPKHWINDPNAPMFYKGFYHLFYQYNPKGSVWGNIVWAHSVSEDLINWTPLDPAIEPSKPFDQFGCWSGSATILPGEKPVILYTGIIAKEPEPGYQVQNYAIPKDYNDPYLKKWIKPDDNPIIKPTKENVSAFRDPTTAWKLNGQWEITVGSKQDTTGMSYLYRSPDFIKWTLVDHPLHQKEDTGMWECPDFYPVATTGKDGLDTMVVEGDIKHVFKVSLDITRNEYYTIGKYDTKEDKYIPDEGMIDGWAGLRYDWGNFYASKSFYDPAKKRRILWGWSNESSTEHESVKKGWAGIQCIPRSVWLDPSGKQLLQWPVEELETLRDKNVQISNTELKQGDKVQVEGITPAQADVDVVFTLPGLDKAEVYDTNWDKTFPPESIARNICQVKGTTEQGGLGPFGLLTLTSKHFEEYTPVFFRVFNTPDTKHKVLMCSDEMPSTLNKHEYKPSFGGFVDVDLADNKISLRSLIDHSVVESFAAGGKTVITSRVYPTKALDDDNAHLYVFNNGTTTITVEKLDAWSMKKPKMN